MTTDSSLRPLPILTPDGELPTGSALEALRAAKMASGYSGLIVPRQAVYGSPEPVLAVGVKPDWLTKYAYLEDWSDHDAIVRALQTILIWDDGSVRDEASLLSEWMKAEVRLIEVVND